MAIRLTETRLRQIIREEARRLVESSSADNPYGVPMDCLKLITSQINIPFDFTSAAGRSMDGRYMRSPSLSPFMKDLISLNQELAKRQSELGQSLDAQHWLMAMPGDWPYNFMKSIVGMSNTGDPIGILSKIASLASNAAYRAADVDRGGTPWVSAEDSKQEIVDAEQQIKALIPQIPVEEIVEFCDDIRVGAETFKKLHAASDRDLISEEEYRRYRTFMRRSHEDLHKAAADLDKILGRRGGRMPPNAMPSQAMLGMDENRRRRSRR
jgi:hypothetical protein